MWEFRSRPEKSWWFVGQIKLRKEIEEGVLGLCFMYVVDTVKKDKRKDKKRNLCSQYRFEYLRNHHEIHFETHQLETAELVIVYNTKTIIEVPYM